MTWIYVQPINGKSCSECLGLSGRVQGRTGGRCFGVPLTCPVSSHRCVVFCFCPPTNPGCDRFLCRCLFLPLALWRGLNAVLSPYRLDLLDQSDTAAPESSPVV